MGEPLPQVQRRLGFGLGLKLGLLAAVAASLATVALMWLAGAFFQASFIVPGPGGPESIDWYYVALTTALAALLAPPVLALFLRSGRPGALRVFRLLSLGLLAVSLVPALVLPDEWATRLALSLMHMAAAGIILTIVKPRPKTSAPDRRPGCRRR